jgi:5-methylcytosine-specific restriction endonuclease McrA
MTSSDIMPAIFAFLLFCLAWRFLKALAWQPPQEAYKREFSRVRRDVLARDGHRCQRCGRYMPSGMHVHHIHQRQYGGSNSPANLISLCPDCHHIVHGRHF